MTLHALPACHALWIGGALGPVERACLASFAEAGHPVWLHSYEDLGELPAGVRRRDAGEFLPRSAVVRHRATGSPSLFSDRFRFELLRAGEGVWVDCDMLCLRPLPDEPCLFGYEDGRWVNGAVLRLPHDHPVLDDLCAMFTTPRWVPPWAPRRRRLAWWLRYRLPGNFGLPDLPWGTLGPRALTWHLGRHGLAARARPTEVFYPVTLREAARLTAPDPAAVRACVTPRTLGIHLWGQRLRARGGTAAPGSFLASVADGTWRSVLGLPGSDPGVRGAGA